MLASFPGHTLLHTDNLTSKITVSGLSTRLNMYLYLYIINYVQLTLLKLSIYFLAYMYIHVYSHVKE